METSTASFGKETGSHLGQVSLLREDVPWLDRLALSIQLALACAALMGNLLTLAAFARFERLRTPSNTILASLAMADLLTGFVILIAPATSELEPASISMFCFQLITTLPFVASVTHLICVAVDRFLAIFFPLRYSTIMGHALARKIVIITWGLCIIHTFGFTFYSMFKDPAGAFYVLDIESLVWFSGCVVFLGCVYVRIWCATKKQLISIAQLDGSNSAQNDRANKNRVMKSNNKATKKITFILLAYVISWGPNAICVLVVVMSDQMELSAEVLRRVTLFRQTGAFCLGLASSCVNIFIYASTSKDFRHAYVEIFKKLFQCDKCITAKTR